MRMHVDKPGRDEPSVGVELPTARLGDDANVGDAIAVDGDIRRHGLGTEPIDHQPVTDHQIMRHARQTTAATGRTPEHAPARRLATIGV